MKKIFLFLEDPAELSGFEVLLRKLSFDALSASKETQVLDRMLGFYPDLAIIPGKGRSGIDGLKLAAKVRKSGFHGRLILTWPWSEATPNADLGRAGVDGTISTPIDPESALPTIAELLRLDANALLGKFSKLDRGRAKTKSSDMMIVKSADRGRQAAGDDGFDAEESEASFMVSGGAGARAHSAESGRTNAADAARRTRNAKFLAAHVPETPAGLVPRARLAESVEELRRASAGENAAASSLNEQKREFVRAVFRQAHSAMGNGEHSGDKKAG